MFQVFAQEFRSLKRGLGGCARQNQSELLSAVTASGILATRALREEIPQRAQKGVASLMTESVIEPLEVIDVDHEQRDSQIVANRTLQSSRSKDSSM